MAIDSKVSFMNQTEKKLSATITADDMAKVMTIIADVLEGYEMREVFINDDRNDDLLDCYLEALKVQGRSPKTIERYRYVIGRMMKEINIPTRRITVYHLRSYLANLQKRGIKDTTIEGIREVFTAYFNWLQRESLIDKNPTSNLGAIKCAKIKKRVFTNAELDRLKTNCDSIRDKAIITFLSSTGCRISEVTSLNRDALDFNGLECLVHGKGNKERTVYIDDVTAMVLKKYLTKREDDNPALFVSEKRPYQRITPSGIRAMLKELAKRSEVEHVHPHKFRRTLATDLARHGMPIQEVANILGHDKIDTTMKYLVLNDYDIKHSYRRYA